MNVAGQQIPVKIYESLSALTNSSEATQEAHSAALKKLGAYEQALGIAPKTSDTIGARLSAVQVAAEQVVTQVLPAPLSEEQRSSLSVQDLLQQATNLTTAIQKATQLQAIINEDHLANFKSDLAAPPPTGTSAELPDSRKDFGPHKAYLFSVAPSKGPVMDELKELLGEKAAKLLAQDWGDRCDLNECFKGGQVALFLDSNNKARSRQYAESGDKTTQADDFQATRHECAGDLATTLLCARICKKVRDKAPLSDGEQQLYQKLKDGVLRSFSGALGIIVSGRLRASVLFYDSRDSSGWALGSPLSPELKAA